MSVMFQVECIMETKKDLRDVSGRWRKMKNKYLLKELGIILPKKETDKATILVNQLRKKIDSGKLNLSKYEEEF